jgi:hypothetical protein
VVSVPILVALSRSLLITAGRVRAVLGSRFATCRHPTDVTPALEMVKPRPEVTVQVVPLTSDRQLKGPMPAVWP